MTDKGNGGFSPDKRGGRRAILRGAMALAVLGGAGGLVAMVRGGGYDIDPQVAAGLRAFTAAQYATLAAVARRLVAPDDAAPSMVSADDVGVASFADGYVAGMPAPLRRDVKHLLLFVEQIAPFGAGFARRFTDLLPEEQDRVLGALQSSRVDDLNAGFEALKGLVMLGYYRDPRTWRALGYQGPFVDRPAEGF